MITFNECDFDYVEEFDLRGIDDYGYVDFWKGDDIIRVYIDEFDVDSQYDSKPDSFNPESGNVGYGSYSYDTVNDIGVYTELTDSDGNIYTKEQFLENNPEIYDLDSIIKQAEEFARKLFRQWWEDQN